MSKRKANYPEGRGELMMVKGLAIGIGVILILSITLSYIMTVKDMGDNTLAICGTVILGIGSFISSYFASRKIGTGGMKIGGTVGGILFIITVSCGAVAAGLSFHTATVVKALACVLSGMFGGVMGVNRTAKRKL